MRILSIVAAAMCLSPLMVASGLAAAPPVLSADTPPASVPAAPPTSATPATAKPSPATSATPASGDAAAKHAKRTACLKDAKAKKLVGAAKTSFLKNCVAAP